MTQGQPPLAAGQLDRDAATRATPERLENAWNDPNARLLRLRGVMIPVITDATGNPQLSLIPTEGSFVAAENDQRVQHVYLGRAASGPVFGIADPEPADSEDTGSSHSDSGVPEGETWEHPFEIGYNLDETERELIAVASGLLRWHESAEFSPRDGAATVPALGGWARHDARGGEHFPRTDPAVIVLIEHEGCVLLGSNVLWEAGRFSLLAGFVEAGESLEQTVHREVFEEAGVRLDQVEYVTSQPWPFPRSLMLGFRAKLATGADPEQLTPDPEEISELRWFTPEELRHPGPDLKLPMPLSIARWMIDEWLNEDGQRDGDR